MQIEKLKIAMMKEFDISAISSILVELMTQKRIVANTLHDPVLRHNVLQWFWHCFYSSRTPYDVAENIALSFFLSFEKLSMLENKSQLVIVSLKFVDCEILPMDSQWSINLNGHLKFSRSIQHAFASSWKIDYLITWSDILFMLIRG